MNPLISPPLQLWTDAKELPEPSLKHSYFFYHAALSWIASDLPIWREFYQAQTQGGQTLFVCESGLKKRNLQKASSLPALVPASLSRWFEPILEHRSCRTDLKPFLVRVSHTAEALLFDESLNLAFFLAALDQATELEITNLDPLIQAYQKGEGKRFEVLKGLKHYGIETLWVDPLYQRYEEWLRQTLRGAPLLFGRADHASYSEIFNL